MNETADKSKIPIRVWIVLASIVVIGSCLRLYHLGESSLWYDEAASIRIAQWFNSDLDIFNPELNNEAPLMGIQAKMWVGIVESLGFTEKTDQSRDFMIRLLPAFWSILSIVLVFGVCREFFRKDEPALIAAFLLAISPFHLVYAQELRIYSFYVFAGLLALYFMHKALFRGYLRDWMLMSFLFALLVYAHFIAVWTVFAFNLAFIWYFFLYKKKIIPWFYTNAAMMVMALPVLYLAYYAHGLISEVEYAWFPEPDIKVAALTWKAFFAGYGETSWAYIGLFLAGTVFFLLGAAALYYAGQKYVLGVLLIVTLFPVLFNLVYWRIHDFSFYEFRTYIVSGTALLMLVAYGIWIVPSQLGRLAVLTIFTLLSAPLLRDYYQHRIHPVWEHRIAIWDKVAFREASEFLQQHWGEKDLLGYTGYFSAFSMRYYFPEEQFPIALSEEDIIEVQKWMGTHNLEVFPELKPVLLQPQLDKHDRVWFLRTHGITFEQQTNAQIIEEWLDKNLTRKESHKFYGITLTLYENR